MENMDKLEIGTRLIAKSECRMRDGSGNALIIGKEYRVIDNQRWGEIIVKSELFRAHFFSLDKEKNDYWKRYFDLAE